jgi:hypothetical protein
MQRYADGYDVFKVPEVVRQIKNSLEQWREATVHEPKWNRILCDDHGRLDQVASTQRSQREENQRLQFEEHDSKNRPG